MAVPVNCYPWLLYSWTLTKYRLQIADPQGKLERFLGVLAQLVERLNGIEEVRGSNPLGSKAVSVEPKSNIEGSHYRMH